MTTSSNNANTNNNKQKQRIVVPTERFARLMGPNACNIRIIQEVTCATLELEDKKIPPNQDRSLLIRGDSSDIINYAKELLQALIADADVDLFTLLSPPQPAPATPAPTSATPPPQQQHITPQPTSPPLTHTATAVTAGNVPLELC